MLRLYHHLDPPRLSRTTALPGPLPYDSRLDVLLVDDSWSHLSDRGGRIPKETRPTPRRPCTRRDLYTPSRTTPLSRVYDGGSREPKSFRRADPLSGWDGDLPIPWRLCVANLGLRTRIMSRQSTLIMPNRSLCRSRSSGFGTRVKSEPVVGRCTGVQLHRPSRP